MSADPRRTLPSVSALLELPGVRALFEHAPRAVVADAARAAVDDARRDATTVPADWTLAVGAALDRLTTPSLRPLFNATGVVLHTNLGRAPLAPAAIEAIARVASGFCTLEYDVARGERGSRDAHCTALLTELTGAEDAVVVNNCAAALVLALDATARGREAIVSRGELVEIGGSFRVPEIMERSGARLVEVGTTNRTHAADYIGALGPETGAIVKVHRSNFTLDGYVAEVGVSELATIAARQPGVALVRDFGSGLLLSLAPWGLDGETTAADEVRSGATLVLMSGDKLLGGPQAGILLGARDVIARVRANPLRRALRVDKLTLAALEATLTLYRDPAVAVREIPALAMLTSPLEHVRERALRISRQLSQAGIESSVVDSEATVGGGAFPSARIPSAALRLAGDAVVIERRLRLEGQMPVIARVRDGGVLLDVRSVPAAHDDAFTRAIVEALT